MPGYRRLPCSDPKEQALRDEWYAAQADIAAGLPGGTAKLERASAKLSAYLWARVESDVAADRKQHPKAKRNQPVRSENLGAGRVLP